MNSNKKEAVVISVIFIVALFVITAVSILKPSKAFSETENRYLQTRPKFSLNAYFSGEFEEVYEDYIADQFAGRDSWIALKATFEQLRGMKEMNNVYFGKDGYLIEKDLASLYESDQAQKNIGFLSEFMEKYPLTDNLLSVQVLMVPTAGAVLNDKLPDFAPVYDQEQWISDLKDKSGITVVPDLFRGLANEKDRQVYYRTDHHWTTYGAFLGYQAWMKSIGMVPLEEKDFNIETVTDDFFGTLNSKVNVKSEADSILMYRSVNRNYSQTVDYPKGSKVTDGLYDSAALKTKDKYAYFLGGNYGIVDIKTQFEDDTDLTKNRHLLIIKDSYANCFVPVASLHFEETIMMDLRHTNQPVSQVISDYGITDILVLYSTKNFAEDKNIYKLLY